MRHDSEKKLGCVSHGVSLSNCIVADTFWRLYSDYIITHISSYFTPHETVKTAHLC